MIKNSTDTKLSFQQGSYDFFLGDHTGITGHEKATASLLRGHLGRLLDKVYTVVDDEAIRAIKTQVGECEEWTELALFPVAVKMIIMVSQRVFVGEPLCRDEQWVSPRQTRTLSIRLILTFLFKDQSHYSYDPRRICQRS